MKRYAGGHYRHKLLSTILVLTRALEDQEHQEQLERPACFPYRAGVKCGACLILLGG